MFNNNDFQYYQSYDSCQKLNKYMHIYTMCVMLVYSEGYQSRENAHNIHKEEDTEA